MSSKERGIAEVVQMYKIRQEEEKCFPDSPFKGKERLSFSDPLQENQRKKKGQTNLIFHLYCEGDLQKSKFRLVVHCRKQTEPQDPFCSQGTNRKMPLWIWGENKPATIQRRCFQKPSGIKVTGNIFYFYFLWYSYSTQLFLFSRFHTQHYHFKFMKKKSTPTAKIVSCYKTHTDHHSGLFTSLLEDEQGQEHGLSWGGIKESVTWNESIFLFDSCRLL